MVRARWRGWLALATLCGSCLAGAHAQDVWGYVDANGVAHFANERLDERYQLFFRSGQAFDTAGGVARTNAAPGPSIDTARQVAVPTSSQNRLLAFFDVSNEFKTIRPLMREAAQQSGIDFELVQAVIAAESGYNRQAVSPKGAVGLMQIMPATGERYGVVGDKSIAANGKLNKGARSTSEKLFDPKTNLGVGTRYLRDLMRMFPGRLDLVLAAYNAGEGAVQRNGNQIPPYRETQNYVQTVMALYQALKPPVPVSQPVPQRVRMQIGGAVPGRANMPPSLMPSAATGAPPQLMTAPVRLVELPP